MWEVELKTDDDPSEKIVTNHSSNPTCNYLEFDLNSWLLNRHYSFFVYSAKRWRYFAVPLKEKLKLDESFVALRVFSLFFIFTVMTKSFGGGTTNLLSFWNILNLYNGSSLYQRNMKNKLNKKWSKGKQTQICWPRLYNLNFCIKS